MTEKIILHGRTVVPGVVAGPALVSHETISGWGGIDPATGTIIERRHELSASASPARSWSFPEPRAHRGGRASSRPPA
jgi:uncharacterized protein